MANPKKLSLIVALFSLLTIGLNFSYFRPEKYSDSQSFYYTDRHKIQSETSGVLFDYLPATAKKPEQPSHQLFDLRKTDFMVTGPGEYIVNQYYFPGWQGKIDNQPVAIEPDPLIGRIKVEIPSGEHNLKLKLGKTDIQRWSDIISLLSWSFLLIYMIKNVTRFV